MRFEGGCQMLAANLDVYRRCIVCEISGNDNMLALRIDSHKNRLLV